MTDFAKGYRASYRLVEIDRSSWGDGSDVGRLREASAMRSIDGDAPLVDSGNAAFDGDAGGERYVRLWMDCRQGGAVEPAAIATFLMMKSAYSSDGSSDAVLWSVLKYAEEQKMPVGHTVMAGRSCAEAAAEVLRERIDAPVSVVGNSPALAYDVTAGEDESCLAFAWALLPDEWCITTDGFGNVLIHGEEEPKAIGEDEIVGTVSVSFDVTGVPNVMRVSEDGRTVEAVNMDDTSATSIPSRGRRIYGSPVGMRRADETLEDYAERELREQSKVVYTATYTREYRDDIGPGSWVAIPRQEGSWQVVSQSITCGAGATVEETARRSVDTWL